MNYSRLSQKTPQAPKRQWWKLIIWALVIGGLYWMIMGGSYSSDIEETVSSVESSTEFIITNGTSPTTIAEQLEEDEIIISASSFIKYLKTSGLDTQIYAGKYTVSPHMTIPEIAKTLTTPAEYISIVVPEGLTIAEMDARFASKGIFAEGEFLKCIEETCSFSGFSFLPESRDEYEGYLFPATYSLKETEVTPQNLATQMVQAFKNRIQMHDLDTNTRSLHDIVVMASIIEKESSSHQGEESSQIAGVLWNRVDQSIPLGADATTRYALSKASAALTKTDLQHDGPFNTRLNLGLPPYAISAPGDASLKAAANPADTDYLYYLHSQDGQIHFAYTNAQHNSNKSTFCGGSCE